MAYKDQEEYLDNLALYVREAVNNNHTVEEIREHLKKSGHSNDAIDQAILRA